jgi:hypothetical protein
MTQFGFVLLVAVFLVFAGYQQWLRYQRRLLVHRERLAAIEKGVDLPPVDDEMKRRAFNTQRMLLFAGLIWMSLGAGALSGDISSLIGNPISLQVGVALVGVGLSHLIVYAVSRKRDATEGRDL